MPLTNACFTPGAEPTVSETMPPRRSASAAALVGSVPSPSIGTAIVATWRSGLAVTVTGPFMWPVAVALASSALTAAAICGVPTSLASTTTTPGIWPPGNAACMRS